MLHLTANKLCSDALASVERSAEGIVFEIEIFQIVLEESLLNIIL